MFSLARTNLSRRTTSRVALAFESQYEAHQPGRFRVTLTDAADPNAASIPGDVLLALEKPVGERTDAQKMALLGWFRASVPGPVQTADAALTLDEEDLRGLRRRPPDDDGDGRASQATSVLSS